jgi:hypothetical protein
MIYFFVDCDFAAQLISESELDDFVCDYDARVFRTDGQIVEASFFDEHGSWTWQQVKEKF